MQDREFATRGRGSPTEGDRHDETTSERTTISATIGLRALADDEFWYRCQDCEGTGEVNVPDGPDESVVVSGTCPVCNGIGVVEGDEDDEQYGWVRVPSRVPLPGAARSALRRRN